MSFRQFRVRVIAERLVHVEALGIEGVAAEHVAVRVDRGHDEYVELVAQGCRLRQQG